MQIYVESARCIFELGVPSLQHALPIFFYPSGTTCIENLAFSKAANVNVLTLHSQMVYLKAD